MLLDHPRAIRHQKGSLPSRLMFHCLPFRSSLAIGASCPD
nr:MAG TPA: hypothetical protein [Caudoviricetes sp.]